jgi:hypothetical protein
VLKFYLELMKTRDKQPEPFKEHLKVLIDVETTVNLVLFGVTVLFRLFGDATSHWTQWGIWQHPPPRLRIIIAVRTALECLDQWGHKEAADKLQSNFATVLSEVEEGYHHLTGEKFEVDGLNMAASAEGNQYIDDLRNTWRTVVKPALQNHSFITLV